MSQHRYLVTLAPDERDCLTHLIRAGKSSSYHQVVARVLLKAGSQRGRAPTER